MLMQSFTERLRPLVWMKGWDYIVLWKLSDDHRSIELMDCCCGGKENMDELNFEASSSSSSCTSSMPLPCRDVMFPHPRVKSCDLLDLIPSSMVLDTGVHAQTLCSNQPSWLNYSHTSDSTLSQEGFGTRVLIPLSVGLVELYVTKQVPEDEEVIDLIRIQYNIFVEQQNMSNAGATVPFSSAEKDQICSIFQQQEQISKDLPHEISADRIHLSTPSPHNSSGMFLDGTGVGVGAYESSIFSPSMENAFPEVSNASRENRWMDDQMHHDQDSFVCNRSDESEPNEDEDDPRSRRSRNGKGPPQSKNLDAERKRRKKLNERLYALRALVPNISKLDRASILGDAIEYVKELQKQADDLKLELEQHSDDEDGVRKTSEDGNDKSVPTSVVHPNGTKRGPKREQENFGNGCHRMCKQNQEIDFRNEKVQQMEPQVEVYQVDANEFFVKVFCEHKFGGFVRLLEALNALGLEVSNVNTTRHTCLASSIFKVERKNDEIVEADEVKESLLELTRNPTGMWPNNGAGADSEIITTDTIDMDNSNNNNNNNNNNSNDYEQQYALHHDHGSYQINSHHHQH